MENLDYKAIGSRIRAKRKEMKLTQEKLAEKVEISTSHMGEIERGKSVCSLAVMVRIADILELNLDTLIRGVSEQTASTALNEIYESVPKEDKPFFLTICEDLSGSFHKK